MTLRDHPVVTGVVTFAAGALAVGVVLGLTSCGASTAAKTGDGQVTSRTVRLPDGGEATCIFWVPIDNSGIATAEGAQMECDFPMPIEGSPE